jgi:hypothetical protein
MRPSFNRTIRCASLRQRFFMRDQKQCRLRARVQREQQIGHVRAGLPVEISGGLVGEQYGRTRRDRTGQRHPLLLAAGQLPGIVIDARPSRPRRAPLGARECVFRARQLERHGHVLERRHGRDQMEGLEHDADGAAAEAGERIFAEFREVGAGDADAPRGRRFEPGRHHQERRFAGARRPEQRDRFAARDFQRDTRQDVDRACRARQRQPHIVQSDRGGRWLHPGGAN